VAATDHAMETNPNRKAETEIVGVMMQRSLIKGSTIKRAAEQIGRIVTLFPDRRSGTMLFVAAHGSPIERLE